MHAPTFPPKMALSRAWLRALRLGYPPDGLHPDITAQLEKPTTGHGSTGHGVSDFGCYAPAGDFCHFGSILRLTAPEQSAVYVIGEYDMYADSWTAHWPD